MNARPTSPSTPGISRGLSALLFDFFAPCEEYGSAKDEAQTRIRATLIGPYEAQADEERRAEQKARGKRKTGEPVDAAARDDKARK